MPEINLLMVDDSDEDIKLVSHLLSGIDSSIKVHGVTDSEGCLEALRSGNYDLVLADYELAEEGDGRERH